MSDTFQPPQISDDLDTKPAVPQPAGTPPGELVTDDVVACGGADKTAATTTDPVPPATTATSATTATTPAAPRSISKDLGTKPEIPKPAGKPPAKLVVKDIVKGKGKTARSGRNVTVQ